MQCLFAQTSVQQPFLPQRQPRLTVAWHTTPKRGGVAGAREVGGVISAPVADLEI